VYDVFVLNIFDVDIIYKRHACPGTNKNKMKQRRPKKKKREKKRRRKEGRGGKRREEEGGGGTREGRTIVSTTIFHSVFNLRKRLIKIN